METLERVLSGNYHEEEDESRGNEKGKPWMVSATRDLCRTLPFDSGKAILFLPEKGIKGTTTCGDPYPDEGEGEQCRKLTGNEAKQFYEDVLSMPEQSRKTDRRREGKGEKKAKSIVSDRTSQPKHRGVAVGVVEQKNDAGFISVSQLFCSAQEGDLVSLRSALSRADKAYDVNVLDNFNWTLLMCASHAGHMDVVNYLLSKNAKWREFVDRSGYNAADLARAAGHYHVAELIENYEHFQDHHFQRCQTGFSCKRCGEGSGSTKVYPPSKRRKRVSYYCKTCKLNVVKLSDCSSKHETSTVHQFSCQHHPKVSSYGIPKSNRGYQMLVRGGWDPGKGLGSLEQGQQYPVKTILKQDRLGFGLNSKESGPRVTHFSAHDKNAIRTCGERDRVKGIGKESSNKTKREMMTAAERERRWEIRMRQYLNANHEY